MRSEGKQAVALAMLAKGLPLSDVAAITGLPLSELKLIVPLSEHRATIKALGLDPVEADSARHSSLTPQTWR